MELAFVEKLPWRFSAATFEVLSLLPLDLSPLVTRAVRYLPLLMPPLCTPPNEDDPIIISSLDSALLLTSFSL